MKARLILTLLIALAIPAGAQQPATPAVTAKPEPIKPASVAPAGKSKTDPPTVIDSDDADFNLKESIFTYSHNVTVDSPQFHLTTDGAFTVYMKKNKPAEDKKEPKAPVSSDAATKGLSEPANGESSIDHATAIGREVVILKTDADGKTKIGKCRNLYYDGKTGDATLRDWPQVQDGANIIVAAEASTWMVLTKDGKFKAHGRTRSDVVGGWWLQPQGQGKLIIWVPRQRHLHSRSGPPSPAVADSSPLFSWPSSRNQPLRPRSLPACGMVKPPHRPQDQPPAPASFTRVD